MAVPRQRQLWNPKNIPRVEDWDVQLDSYDLELIRELHPGLFFAAPDAQVVSSELRNAVQRVLSKLSRQQRFVIKHRFGFKSGESRTLDDVATRFRPPLSRERVRQIESKALRRLRHPSLANKLRDFSNWESPTDADRARQRWQDYELLKREYEEKQTKKERDYAQLREEWERTRAAQKAQLLWEEEQKRQRLLREKELRDRLVWNHIFAIEAVVPRARGSRVFRAERLDKDDVLWHGYLVQCGEEKFFVKMRHRKQAPNAGDVIRLPTCYIGIYSRTGFTINGYVLSGSIW